MTDLFNFISGLINLDNPIVTAVFVGCVFLVFSLFYSAFFSLIINIFKR